MTGEAIAAGLGFGAFGQIQPLPGGAGGVSPGSDNCLAGNGGVVEESRGV